jgi:menaquinone-dependent protoporphyrinogen IX oxidase
MEVLVVYKSISGFTARYANWIAEEFKTEAIPVDEFKARKISESTIVIYGGSLHAVGINGLKEFSGKIRKTPCKEIVLFAVGASPHKDGIEEEIMKANAQPTLASAKKLFYLRGGFDYSKLDLGNKFLMTLLKIKMSRKKDADRTGDERGMLASYKKPLDATKKENLAAIIAYIKSIE